MSEAELVDGAGSDPTKGSLPPRIAPVRFAAFTLDLDGCSLSRTDGGDIPLTHSEFALLREFVRHPGRVLSRDYLLDALAGKRSDPFDRSIDMLVGRLRRKIEPDAKPPRLIVTVLGEGYKFAAPIRAETPKPSSESATPEPTASAPKQAPPRWSIVVLPFANLTGDPGQEHFVDGVTESLTTDLSRIRGSFVIGRNTAFAYKGRHVDARRIGSELNVRYILEGSVQGVGARMRVSVQLIDAETGNHLWAERFDKPLCDPFDTQDEIVARLSNVVTAQVTAAEAERTKRAPNPDAMDLNLQGWALWDKGITAENLAEARRLFERALALNPADVRARVAIANVDIAGALSFSPDDRVERLVGAETALHEALCLDPENAIAHLCLGIVQIHTNRAADGIRECERALELNRNLVNAHGHIGYAKIMLGRAEETEAHIQAALRLSPRDVHVYLWCMYAGAAKLNLNKDDEAVNWLRRSIEINRKFAISHFLLAAALTRLGRVQQARSETQAGLAIDPSFTIARFRARALANNSNEVAEPESIIDALRKAGVPEQ
jgi:TolB-like protein/Flp pilus assembly protein TadD